MPNRINSDTKSDDSNAKSFDSDSKSYDSNAKSYDSESKSDDSAKLVILIPNPKILMPTFLILMLTKYVYAQCDGRSPRSPEPNTTLWPCHGHICEWWNFKRFWDAMRASGMPCVTRAVADHCVFFLVSVYIVCLLQR